MPKSSLVQPINLAVLGKGAWGTVLAMLAERNGHRVQLWSHRESTPLSVILKDAAMVISAVSVQGLMDVVSQVNALSLPPNVILVSATKGLEPISRKTPSQIWQSALPHNPVVVLSGPNLATEIRQGLPAATVVASHEAKAAETVQQVLASDRFRVYTNSDPLGTELGGTLKNVVAIAVGVCDGLALGANAKSALITRALAEIIRVGVEFGAEVETFAGLSGLGDLLATCSSTLSRNYRVGSGLAQGKSLDQVLADIQETAEGVNTAHVLVDLAHSKGIAVPISYQVHLLLNGKITPQQAVEALMERDLKPEV